jgi:hypothetical protein
VILNLTKKISSDSTVTVLDYHISIFKITALWAFSESAFGGILHALAVPFRGIFINGAAVLFISLIALFSKSNKEILKSTLMVLIIKALVSPHTPLTAYFAVSIQGLLGYLFFLPKSFFRISTLLLGVFTLFLSGFQKIIVLTLVFGNTLWKSVNVFIQQISKDFLSIKINSDIQYGYIIVLVYLAIHIIAGVFIGFYAGLLPSKINRYKNEIPRDLFLQDQEELFLKRKKKSWLLRPSGILIFSILLILLIYSYISPSSLGIRSNEIIVMLIRSITIMLIWFLLIGPIVRKLFQKYLSPKKSFYAKEIGEIMELFPRFKKIISFCWKNSSNKKGFKRIHYFLSTSFYYLLLS